MMVSVPKDLPQGLYKTILCWQTLGCDGLIRMAMNKSSPAMIFSVQFMMPLVMDWKAQGSGKEVKRMRGKPMLVCSPAPDLVH